MAKLFVGSLPWATTSDDLTQLFSNAGTVITASVLQDRMTGRSRGFGFVEMSDEDAKKAIEMYNDFEYGGRKLIVNEARPKTEGGPRRSFGGGHGRGGFGGHRDNNDNF